MRMCDDGHDEIVYECKQCPVCKAMREIDDLERENSELREELEATNGKGD
jgi:transcription initiation factor IIE alpha subunit